jgi:nucleoside-diphosphate-sugar epimerase
MVFLAECLDLYGTNYPLMPVCLKPSVILIIGASQPLGSELTIALSAIYGSKIVIAADCGLPEGKAGQTLRLEVKDYLDIRKVVSENSVNEIYLLAPDWSNTVEKDARAVWELTTKSLLSILKIARDYKVEKVFWPSSIAVFGPGARKYNCPQETPTVSDTMKGISKSTGEYWCNYFFEQHGLDVRSLRLPGLISTGSMRANEVTDFANEILHAAVRRNSCECFLEESTALPMIYIKDAVRAIMMLMRAPASKVTVRTSYNVAALSFAPCDLVAEIKKHKPDFRIYYQPDQRQSHAEHLPASIDDLQARTDWGWTPLYSLADAVKTVLEENHDQAFCSEKSLQQHPDFPTQDAPIV